MLSFLTRAFPDSVQLLVTTIVAFFVGGLAWGKKPLKHIAACVTMMLLGTSAALADTGGASGIFSGAQSAGTSIAGSGLNAIIAILIAFGAVGLVVGGFGFWKQPEKRQMWAHIMEGASIPIILGVVALAYFNLAPGMVTSLAGGGP